MGICCESRNYHEGVAVSAIDKVKNAFQRGTGQAKERTGKATGDRSLQAEGQADQTKGNLKDAGEQIKDAGGKLKDALE